MTKQNQKTLTEMNTEAIAKFFRRNTDKILYVALQVLWAVVLVSIFPALLPFLIVWAALVVWMWIFRS